MPQKYYFAVLIFTLVATIQSYILYAKQSRPLKSQLLASKCFQNLIFISKPASILLGLSLLIGQQQPVLAAVGEGDLPPGAVAFTRLLKSRDEWKKLAGAVQTRGEQMGKEEILSSKMFLKLLANEYNDMDFLANSITDANKAKEARRVAKEFRSVIRDCDDAASDGNILKIKQVYDESDRLFGQFLEYLNDVPDEI